MGVRRDHGSRGLRYRTIQRLLQAIRGLRPSPNGAGRDPWEAPRHARIEPLEARCLLAATPIISEFLAANSADNNPSVYRDEDGDTSDWIELYNPSAEPIPLDGYYLSDNADNLTKWRFPAVNLPAGQYMVVFASNKDRIDPARPLHTNFALNQAGGYLGLVAPDGTTIVSEYDPAYPEQLDNISYGLSLTGTSTPLLGSGALANVWVPSDDSLGSDWTKADHLPDGRWSTGPFGVGFDVADPSQRTSGFSVGMLDTNSANLNNIGVAQGYLNDPSSVPGGVAHNSLPNPVDRSAINLGSRGRANTGDLTLPNGYGGKTSDESAAERSQFALRITGDVSIPAGTWTILVHSNAGFMLTLPGVSFTGRSGDNYTGTSWTAGTVPADTLVYGAARSFGDTFGQFTVPAGGLQNVRLQLDYYETTGSDGVELFIASGQQTSYSVNAFSLLEDNVKGWTVKTATSQVPSVFTPLIKTDLEQGMYNQRSSAYIRVPFSTEDTNFEFLKLRMRYEDGFVAYLNGTKVASANAPASPAWDGAALGDRPAASGLNFQDFVFALPPGLLKYGDNVLAIHALNDSAASGDFYIEPLLEGMRTAVVKQYFRTPTPGSANATGEQIDMVQDTTFSHDRGFYSAPFMLTIATDTEGAQIRYTLDGSAPTPTTGLLYTAPILISGTTTVRAAAFKAGWMDSDVDAQSYFFLDDVLNQYSNGQAPEGWPQGPLPTNQVLDHGMDADVVSATNYANAVALNGLYIFAATNGTAGTEIWRSNGTVGGTAMIMDIKPGAAGSSPLNLTVLGGAVYFQANAGVGPELWRTDGTEAGTYGLGGGALYPAELTAAGSRLFFTGFDGGNGYELWVSDGTYTGTRVLKDIYPGTDPVYAQPWGSRPRSLTAVGNTLFFAAYEPSGGLELWKSDGTEAGTVRVKDINPGSGDSSPQGLTAVGSTLYFAASDGTGGMELWKSDGTAAGTVRVKDINPGRADSNPTGLKNVNGTLYFAAYEPGTGMELWKSDGTAGGTVLVKDINNGSASSLPWSFTAVGGTIYFTANDGPEGIELWKSDGTSGGTVLVADIHAGPGDSNPRYLTAIGSTLYFQADNGIAGRELWKSDGTAAGTQLLREIGLAASSGEVANLADVNGTLFFAAQDAASNYSVWKSNGTTSGTTLVKNVNPNSVTEQTPPAYLTNLNGTLLYQGTDAIHGTELFTSDGTPDGTVLVKDVLPGPSGSRPLYLTAVGNTLYFIAYDGVHGDELWKSDGTRDRTMLVKDILPGGGGSSPTGLIGVGGMLFFLASDGQYGMELWKSDGTAAGTVLVKDINPGVGGISISGATAVNNTLFFILDDGLRGPELWKSDGTVAGTGLVKDINPGSAGANLANLSAYNGRLFFSANDGQHGRELWSSDGTEAGTVLVKDINPGPSDSAPGYLTVFKGLLYFAATEASGAELWSSDGTETGTTRVMDINAGAGGSYPSGLTVVGARLFFNAYSPSSGTELWGSDGTAGGTALVKDINAGTGGSAPGNLTHVNGRLFFTAIDGQRGSELWVSDGTEAGTMLVKDIRAGAGGSTPRSLTAAGERLFFLANDGASGTVLWTSDGSEGGTQPANSALASTAARLTVEDMKAIPTFSIVMDLDDLFDPTNNTVTGGIFAHPNWEDGAERKASIELIYPDGRQGFQINGGVRLRGGFSRSTGNPKHAFHLMFRDDPGYGGRLNFPIFGPEGADTFERFDLRSAQNYSWSFSPSGGQGINIRDQVTRDLQLAMEQPGANGDFYYLYINGQFWGLFNSDERPNAYNAAELFGGDQDDYDVVKVEAGPHTMKAIDGDRTAWNEMWTAVRGPVADLEHYMRLQGLNADGTRNPAYPIHIDVDNVIDYMLVNYWGGNLDAPLSNFLSNNRPNNTFAVRPRDGSRGWMFYMHDGEHTMVHPNSTDVNVYLSVDRTGPYLTVSSADYANAQSIFEQLAFSPEFKLRVADRIHKWFFNEGVLTPETATSLFMARKTEIDRAIVAESARWGDAKRETPFTRNAEWTSEINKLLANYLPYRSGIVLNQLAADGFYPMVAAPEFNQNGGSISSGFVLSFADFVGPGTLYYTLDGNDPRLTGGAVRNGAAVYQPGQGVPLSSSAVVKARVLLNGTWSALSEATFTYDLSALRITEVMYNPSVPAGSAYVSEDYEFIEIANTGRVPLDLTGVRLGDGIDFSFPSRTLAPEERVLVVKNTAAFLSYYGAGLAPKIVGQYVGTKVLSDSADRIELLGPAGEVIAWLDYKDGWYPITDGQGFSLVAVDPNAPPGKYDNQSNWRPSDIAGGRPGAFDPGLAPGSVIINEVMSLSDSAVGDWIELYNPSEQDIPLGGWYLSNDPANLAKWRIPDLGPDGSPMRIKARDYLLFTAADFGSAFDISGTDPVVYVTLSSSDGAGGLGGYREKVDFGPADKDVSFGLHRKSTGGSDFTALASPTPGAANTAPHAVPVIINEIMYNPAAGGDEFIELRNLTGSSLALYDFVRGAGWKFTAGVDYTFTNTDPELPAFGYGLVISSANNMTREGFRSKYAIPASVPIYGPYNGSLSDGGERLELSRPADQGDVFPVPYVLVDLLNYDDEGAWPSEPDAKGPSLLRLSPTAYGNDAGNWAAGPFGGTPGAVNRQEAPMVDLGADGLISQGGTFSRLGTFLDANANQSWSASVNWGDGSPLEPLSLSQAKTFNLAHAYAAPGTFKLTVTVTDSAGGVGTDSFTLTVLPGLRLGSAGADTYTLRLDASGTFVEFTETLGGITSSYSIARAYLPAVQISPGGGDDRVIVDLANGNPIAGGLSIDGGDGADLLQVWGTDGADIGTLWASQLDFAGASLTYSRFETIQIEGGAGDDLLVISAALPQAPIFNAGSGNDRLIIQAGTYELNAANLSGAALSLRASGDAQLRLSTAYRLTSLYLTGNASLSLAAGGQAMLITSYLLLDSSATLDVGDNALIVRSSPKMRLSDRDRIGAMVRTGRQSQWAGPGLISSALRGDSQGITGLAAVLNDRGSALPLHTLFNGEPVGISDILVQVAFEGDADLNGRIDASDYFRINRGQAQALGGYAHGDFNYDTLIDLQDYNLLDRAFLGSAESKVLSAEYSALGTQAAGLKAPAAAMVAAPRKAVKATGKAAKATATKVKKAAPPRGLKPAGRR